jgi:ferredoxin
MATVTNDRTEAGRFQDQAVLDSRLLKQAALEAGADDAAVADVHDPLLATQATDAERLLPGAKTFVSLAIAMNSIHIRSPYLGVANGEFRFAGERADRTAHNLANLLAGEGVRAAAVPVAFPMDTHCWPGKAWVLSHKTIAEAAGLGRIGLSRNLLHPRFGTFMILATVVIDRPVDRYGERLQRNPCIGCKSCVRACPTGAIGETGAFNFINCMTHNYRYRLGGFVDWVESIADGRKTYRRRFSDAETVSMWQSLSYGANYTCCNCMGACPAGTDYLEEYQTDPHRYEREVVEDLLHRGGGVFVLPGSDAEARASALFPAERVRRVRSGVRPRSARAFLASLPLVFQPGQAKDVHASYHFIFSGADPLAGTVRIDGAKLTVVDGAEGQADLTISARGDDWLAILAGDLHPVWAVMTGRLKLKGDRKKLRDFQRCFPL